MPRLREQQEQAHRERRVAHARDHECLLRRRPVGRIAVPEPDQQIAAQAHAFPAEIQQQQVVGQHQREHGRHEQVHVGEKAAVALVVPHELSRIEVDEEADEGDHQHHDQREGVEVEARSAA